MKILILGGDGMLGHQLLLSLQQNHDVRVTLRQDMHAYQQYDLYHEHNSYFNVDICREQDLIPLFEDFRPQAVINAVGIVKQRKSAKDSITCIEVNALMPHKLAVLCEKYNARMVHISTDCVFTGNKGWYTEDDLSDAEDLYGKTKYLGEVHEKHCVTLRTSIIGLELARKTSLIEWFLGQKGHIKGFTKAIYTGLTTLEMSRVIERVLTQHPELSGVWHVSTDVAIDKYDLLTRFSRFLGRTDVEIAPDASFVCDRSLASDKFRRETGYQPPSWDNMLQELAKQYKQRVTQQQQQGALCNA